MNQKAVLVPEGTFRSPLIRITSILCAAAAALAFISVPALFLPNYLWMYLVSPDNDVYVSIGITWVILHCAFLIFSFLCSLLMAACLLRTVKGNVQEGMDLLGRGTRALRITLTFIAAVALVAFVVLLIFYSIAALSLNDGIILFFSGLLAELLMGTIAAAVFLLLYRFLETLADTAATIARTVISGILRAPSISMFSATGFLILGIVNTILSVTRFLTFKAWSATDDAPFITTLLAVPALMYLLSGAACVLLFLYLRKFKMTSEYLLYKGTPVEEMSGGEM